MNLNTYVCMYKEQLNLNLSTGSDNTHSQSQHELPQIRKITLITSSIDLTGGCFKYKYRIRDPSELHNQIRNLLRHYPFVMAMAMANS
jgi:hypothetical protein